MTGYQGTLTIHEADVCSICKADELEMLDTWRGLLCSSCTRKCKICGDWMLDEDGVKDINGDEAHKCCAEDFNLNHEDGAVARNWRRK